MITALFLLSNIHVSFSDGTRRKYLGNGSTPMSGEGREASIT